MMTRTALSTITLLLAAAIGPADAQTVPSKISVAHDAESFVTTISIRAINNRVAWSDVLRGLARARGYDDSALEDVLPGGSFDVTGNRWRIFRMGLNLALSPKIRFTTERAEDRRDEPRLVIRLDRAALMASRRRFKAWFRNALMEKLPGRSRDFGLALDDQWHRAPADRNLVVFIHGLNSRPEELAELLAAARNDGFPCAEFRYPNDQPIAHSARLLAGELAQLAKDHPARGVSLVTHSMGGLVARAAVEDPGLDPGNVRRLIMIAPPNHGSTLARFAFAMEFREHVPGDARGRKVDLFYAFIEDGLAEAARDLIPDSPFLRALNARTRNPKVRYAIFLGTRGPLSEDDLARLRQAVARAGDRDRWVRFFGNRVHTWLEDLDETINAKGDGVVSVARGRLEGVPDTVVLDFSHVGVLQSSGGGDAKKVHQEVLKRLKDRE